MNNEELEEAMNLLFVDQSEATTRLEIQHDLLLALVAEYRRLKDHILIVDETLARIQDRLPRVLIGGLLPPKDELTRLECQIFQTPNLTPAQRKANKTEWSLRLTAYVTGKRMTPDINVRLYSGKKLYGQAQSRSEIPTTLATVSNNFQDDPEMLLGMLRGVTDGEGTPCCPHQFCLLGEDARYGYKPAVEVFIGSDVIEFTSIRPGKGKKVGKALWYLDWRSKP
jgi:hypothetical protein